MSADRVALLPVTVCIPVRNEEKHLPACLASVAGRFEEVLVVDSGSTDRSREIAEAAGATVLDFRWNGQFPKKRNWTLRHHDFRTPWVLFLDADERVTPAFVDELHRVLPQTTHEGFWVRFDNWFMGRWLRHGDPFRKLALFRLGAGEYERLPDNGWSHLDMEVHEHPILDGTTGEIAARMEHRGDHEVSRAADKQRAYARWEACRYAWLQEAGEDAWATLTRRQRFKYRHLSTWWLGWVYWGTAYLWKGGVLDGRAGFVFNQVKRRYFVDIRSRIRERRTGQKILLVNQTFHPDVAATAQHLTDLARRLTREGHSVTVLTATAAYTDPARRFPARETWNGIEIIRVWAPRFDKRVRWSRLLDVAAHLAAFAARLVTLPRFDVVVALTSPPLISVLAVLTSRLRGSRTVLWIMDLNPDEAVAAGWLRARSITTRVLERLLGYSLTRADAVVALDRFMKHRIVAKGVDKTKVAVLSPWSHDHDVAFDAEGRESFRREHRLDNQFVVMYAGNHSPCHPLDTLLDAARQLRSDTRIVFCFVGGGSNTTRVREFVATYQLPNVRQLPYQPRARLGGMLSAADLHVVAMGDAFVGIVHPCKVYNVLRVGTPVLYLGPATGPVVDLADKLPPEHVRQVRHGDAAGVIKAVRAAVRRGSFGAAGRRRLLDQRYRSSVVLPQLVDQIAPAEPGTLGGREQHRTNAPDVLERAA